MRVVYVAQQIARFDEMVARVDIAVVLQRRSIAARWGVDVSNAGQNRPPALHRRVARISFHVVSYPFLEDVHEEVSVLFATNGAVRHQVSGLGVDQALATGLLAPAHIGNLDRLPLARSTIGMNCNHFAPISSRKKR